MTEIRHPRPDLFAAGQPTAEELAGLAAQGVRSVINLRAPDEEMAFDEQAEVERLGLHYACIPVCGPQDLTQENVRRFSEELDAARGRGPVLVHCGTANRVGAMLALDAGFNRGTPPESALALGREAGLASLEPEVERLLARGPQPGKEEGR